MQYRSINAGECTTPFMEPIGCWADLLYPHHFSANSKRCCVQVPSKGQTGSLINQSQVHVHVHVYLYVTSAYQCTYYGLGLPGGFLVGGIPILGMRNTSL